MLKKSILYSSMLALCLSASAGVAMAKDNSHGDHGLDYDHQESWSRALDKAQSPVDIQTKTAVAASKLESRRIQFFDSESTGEVRREILGETADTGHGIQVNTDGVEAMIRGRHFSLTQFHFHTPSEHTLDGKGYPMEGHFVFRADDGRLAVVGVFFEEGPTNAGLQSVITDLKNLGSAKQHNVDIYPLLPKEMAYYHYLGSLTTPPLTENVEWYVLPNTVKASKEQISELHKIYPRNNRNIQPFNDRVMTFYNDQ